MFVDLLSKWNLLIYVDGININMFPLEHLHYIQWWPRLLAAIMMKSGNLFSYNSFFKKIFVVVERIAFCQKIYMSSFPKEIRQHIPLRYFPGD